MNQSPFDFWEHRSVSYQVDQFPPGSALRSKQFGRDAKRLVYEVLQKEEQYQISAGYFVGVDWLIEGEYAMVVAPKLDSRIPELTDEVEIELTPPAEPKTTAPVNVDYMAMLRDCLSDEILYREIDHLVHIDWRAPQISIRQADDLLSPLLIVKYLYLLQQLVRKGLKKSYYPIVRNSNRPRGKILIGANIKANVFKNRLTHTVCGFEEFGINSLENRLLKKALRFAQHYLDNYGKVLPGGQTYFTELINYCRPAFESIDDELNMAEVKIYKANPFFAEYTEALKLGKMLLKRFGYTISNAASDVYLTPPYWIDMPRLFELHVYHFLKQRFKGGLKELAYHFTARGNELDFLINAEGIQMVIDAKYKPYYKYGINHQDVRQVSGYARLKKTYEHLGIADNQLIDCLFIYPDIEDGLSADTFLTADLFADPLPGYRRVYKIGIRIPVK